MPGKPAQTRTVVSTKLCRGEQSIKRGCTKNSSLAIDVTHAQRMVQSGVANPEVALSYVLKRGEITQLQKQELTGCLGTIAVNECPYFPISKSVVEKS